jgi:hypothetical protein
LNFFLVTKKVSFTALFPSVNKGKMAVYDLQLPLQNKKSEVPLNALLCKPVADAPQNTLPGNIPVSQQLACPLTSLAKPLT